MLDFLNTSKGLTHQHFLLDAQLEAQLDFSKRHEITNTFINELINALDMKKLGPLQIYDATDHEYPGWSFIQPITTSHISGHYFEEKNQLSHIHMDIYSCKAFDYASSLQLISNYLKILAWSATLIFREIELEKRKVVILSGNRDSINFTLSQ